MLVKRVRRLRQVQPARAAVRCAATARPWVAHDLRCGDVAVGVALAHAQQGLSIVMHLEIPARHLCVPGQKARRVEMAWLWFETPVNRTGWPLYADPTLAPIRRSRTGSITPVSQWLLHADHALAPIWRSVTPNTSTAVARRNP